jgi:hypothetical protein
VAGGLVYEDLVVAQHVKQRRLAGVVQTEEQNAGALVVQTEVTDTADAGRATATVSALTRERRLRWKAAVTESERGLERKGWRVRGRRQCRAREVRGV